MVRFPACPPPASPRGWGWSWGWGRTEDFDGATEDGGVGGVVERHEGEPPGGPVGVRQHRRVLGGDKMERGESGLGHGLLIERSADPDPNPPGVRGTPPRGEQGGEGGPGRPKKSCQKSSAIGGNQKGLGDLPNTSPSSYSPPRVGGGLPSLKRSLDGRLVLDFVGIQFAERGCKL